MIADWPCLSRTKPLFCLAILASALVAGCVTHAPRISPETLEFEVQGKLAVRLAQRGQSMRFNWRQYTGAYEVQVWGPLGQGRVMLTGTPDDMRVKRGDRVVDRGPPAQVMARHLGFVLPIDVLSSWIRGMPHPDYPARVLATDGGGQVQDFVQSGWRVSLGGQGAQGPAPARIVAANGEQKITVAIKSFIEGA